MGRPSHAIRMHRDERGITQGRELNGDAGLRGVTPHRGGRKAVHMGEGGQVIGYSKPGVCAMQDAETASRCPP